MDYQQQDSQEFLRFLLDGISDDLCRKNIHNSATNTVLQASKSNKILPVLPNVISTNNNHNNTTNSSHNSEYDDSHDKNIIIDGTVSFSKKTIPERLRLETTKSRNEINDEVVSVSNIKKNRIQSDIELSKRLNIDVDNKSTDVDDIDESGQVKIERNGNIQSGNRRKVVNKASIVANQSAHSEQIDDIQKADKESQAAWYFL